MRTYLASRLFGVLFIEYHRARTVAPPFFAHQSYGGEHFFWLGRLYLAYAPPRLVFG